ncbi:MAG: hypothetical protein SFZ23_03980 [Planctomycetota bacterium]|nr:hypothetical protein [Planctomycetota bacterium]
MAQTALGDGRGLQRDLSTTGIGRLPVKDFAAEVRFRNAVVTGNAPGGLSFRGNVGYRDTGEFLGSLGSNDLYGFRRDSLYSGLAGQGLRGTEALQYQFGLTTGNSRANPFGASFVVPRSGSAASGAAAVGAGGLGAASGAVGGLGSSRWENTLGALRSPSTYVASRSLQPALLGIRNDNEQAATYRITSSPLLGIHQGRVRNTEPNPNALPAFQGRNFEAPAAAQTPQGPSSLGSPSNPAVRSAAPASAGAGSLAPASLSALPGAAPLTSGSDLKPRGPFTELRERLAASAPGSGSGASAGSGATGSTPVSAPGASSLPSIEEQLNALRMRLEPNAAQRERVEAQQRQARGEPEADDNAKQASINRTADLIRREGGKIDELLISGGTDTAPGLDRTFSEQIRAGSERLASERYFDAEERFSFALTLKPGDPSAMVGRVHAQLGAGLVISAASNLREVLRNHPEAAGVRYAARLMPPPRRMDTLGSMLRDNIAKDRYAQDSALLMAYVGMLTGDLNTLKEGMRAWESALSTMAPGTPGLEAEQRLKAFLERVWMSNETNPEPAANDK